MSIEERVAGIDPVLATRYRRVEVKMTANEWAIVEKATKELGCTVTGYLIACAIEGAKAVEKTKEKI